MLQDVTNDLRGLEPVICLGQLCREWGTKSFSCHQMVFFHSQRNWSLDTDKGGNEREGN